MKTLYFFTFFIFSLSVQAQNLTLQDCVNLTKLNVGDINEKLVLKDWEFHRVTNKTDTSYATTNWSFASSNYSKQSAKAWLSARTEGDVTISVNYQFQDNDVYKKALEYLQAIGAKKIESFSNPNRIQTTYFSTNYAFILFVNSNMNLVNTKYGIEIMSLGSFRYFFNKTH